MPVIPALPRVLRSGLFWAMRPTCSTERDSVSEKIKLRYAHYYVIYQQHLVGAQSCAWPMLCEGMHHSVLETGHSLTEVDLKRKRKLFTFIETNVWKSWAQFQLIKWATVFRHSVQSSLCVLSHVPLRKSYFRLAVELSHGEGSHLPSGCLPPSSARAPVWISSL